MITKAQFEKKAAKEGWSLCPLSVPNHPSWIKGEGGKGGSLPEMTLAKMLFPRSFNEKKRRKK